MSIISDTAWANSFWLSLQSVGNRRSQPFAMCIYFFGLALNNHYFQTLKNSTVWNAYCGTDTYQQIQQYTGHNLKQWLLEYVSWADDLDSACYQQLEEKELVTYFQW